MSNEEKNTVVITAYDEEASDPIRPEKNLLLAILVSAMNDLKNKGRVGRQAQEFFLNDDQEYVFSFRAICDQLEVSPDKILMVTGLHPQNDEDAPKRALPKSHSVLRSQA